MLAFLLAAFEFIHGNRFAYNRPKFLVFGTNRSIVLRKQLWHGDISPIRRSGPWAGGTWDSDLSFVVM